MEDAILILCLNTGFIYLRTKQIQFIGKGQVVAATINSGFTSLVWLWSTTIGVQKFLEGDWWMIGVFTFANMLGSYLGMRNAKT